MERIVSRHDIEFNDQLLRISGYFSQRTICPDIHPIICIIGVVEVIVMSL